MAIAGVVICGMSIALFKMSEFGVDPFQTFVNGLSGALSFTGLTYGTIYSLLMFVLLVAVFFLDRHYIGFATIINLFGIGYICDFTEWAIRRVLPELVLWQRVVFLLCGIVILCLSSSLYFTADLGVSSYDAMSLILSDKKIARFQYCRIGCDLFCVVLGALLCLAGKVRVFSLVGIGTIITAFFMGPLIEYFNVHISRPLRYGKKQTKE